MAVCIQYGCVCSVWLLVFSMAVCIQYGGVCVQYAYVCSVWLCVFSGLTFNRKKNKNMTDFSFRWLLEQFLLRYKIGLTIYS